MTINHMLI